MKILKFQKGELGITLVALVITIIILLILAGISIASLTQNGIFEKTKLAREKQKNAQIYENTVLANYENNIESYVNGTRQDSASSIQSGSTILWNYENDSNGKITNAGTSDGTSERVFTGYNINNYDAVVVDVGYDIIENWDFQNSLYINKYDFNKNMLGTLPHSATFSKCPYAVKIDSTNNKIIFVTRGSEYIVIHKVIGIKY